MRRSVAHLLKQALYVPEDPFSLALVCYTLHLNGADFGREDCTLEVDAIAILTAAGAIDASSVAFVTAASARPPRHLDSGVPICCV